MKSETNHEDLIQTNLELSNTVAELADEVVWGEAFEGLEATSEIFCGDEVRQMSPQLCMRFVEVSFDGCILDGAVHALDLAVGPGMLGLGRPVIDIVDGAGIFERVGAEEFAARDGLLDQRHGGGAGAGRGEVRADR